jgi:quinol monooxygenase YgiN
MAFVVIATWRAKQGQAERIAKILATVAPINRAEPKVLEFRAHVSTDDPDTFVLYERYTDAGGYDDHKATDAFQEHVIGEAIPNLAERSVQTFHTLD